MTGTAADRVSTMCTNHLHGIHFDAQPRTIRIVRCVSAMTRLGRTCPSGRRLAPGTGTPEPAGTPKEGTSRRVIRVSGVFSCRFLCAHASKPEWMGLEDV